MPTGNNADECWLERLAYIRNTLTTKKNLCWNPPWYLADLLKHFAAPVYQSSMSIHSDWGKTCMEKLFWHLLPQSLIKLDGMHTKSHPRWKPGSSEVDTLKSIYTLSPGKDFIIQALLPRSVHIGPLSWFLVRLFLNWLGISSERSRKTKIKKN